MKIHSSLKLALLGLACFALPYAAKAAPVLVADFRFNGGSLASSVGNSTLTQISVGAGNVTYTGNVTISSINPANQVNTLAITGAANHGPSNYTGFQLDPGTILSGSTGNYSVAMLVNTTATAGWGVLFGLNLNAQNTLLVNGGQPGLTSNNAVTWGTAGSLGTGTWRQLVLTYDGSTVSLYNTTTLGSSTLLTMSSSNWDASGKLMTLFANTNGTLTDNNIDATIGRFEVYTGVLDQTAVNALDLTAVAVPEPATYALLLGGIGMVYGIRRTRRSARP